jgi:hypothetical protein
MPIDNTDFLDSLKTEIKTAADATNPTEFAEKLATAIDVYTMGIANQLMTEIDSLRGELAELAESPPAEHAHPEYASEPAAEGEG